MRIEFQKPGPCSVERKADALVRQANEDQAREAFADAVAGYRRALEIDPAHREAAFNLGGALAELGRLEEAVVCFRDLIERETDIAAAHAELGRVLESYRITRFEPGMALEPTERLDATLQDYGEAIDAVPSLHGCHSSLGQLFTALGRFAEAEEAIAKAAVLTDDLPDALLDVGATMRHPGNLPEAVAMHRQAMALAPDHEYMTEQDYLGTDLTFTDSEILLPDGFEVMMKWERPIMERSAEIICHNHGDVLNVGFGMAIIDTAIQKQGITSHSIIEAHEQVIERAKNWSIDKKNVNIIPSTWQKALLNLPEFDGIYFDTLMPPMIPFLQAVPGLLKPGGVFLYFQFMVQFKNLWAMTGRGLRFGIEHHAFHHIPENHYYRLNEQTPDGRYSAPLFIYQQEP